MKTINISLVLVLLLFLSAWGYGAHNTESDAIDTAGPEGIPMLMEFAKLAEPKDVDTRVKAIARLGELKAEQAVPVIVDALACGRETLVENKDPYWKVRISSSYALAGIGTDNVVDPLKEAARLDRNVMVQRAAIQSLGKLGEKARKELVLVNLFKLLEQTQDNGLANDICWALGQIGDKKAFPYLMKIDQRQFLEIVKQTAKTAISELKFDKPSAVPD
jgi:HEAT repeat protein